MVEPPRWRLRHPAVLSTEISWSTARRETPAKRRTVPLRERSRPTIPVQVAEVIEAFLQLFEVDGTMRIERDAAELILGLQPDGQVLTGGRAEVQPDFPGPEGDGIVGGREGCDNSIHWTRGLTQGW